MGTVTVDDLVRAGLLQESTEPQLTPKGREWLRALEDAEVHEADDFRDSAVDLILSTSGLFR